MILVTGGSGFIGSHTVRALHDAGEQTVIVSRRGGQKPEFLADLPVVVEQGDVADLDSLRAIGQRNQITGIVHLAGYVAFPPPDEGRVEADRRALGGLFNVVQVAQEWGVARMGMASTIGVYGGGPVSEGALTEDLPVALSAPHPIPRSKKIGELVGEQLAESSGVEIINLRISGTWGPLGHDDPFFPAPELIHAAARGSAPDLSNLAGLDHAHPDDGLDLCYVKDTGRAIALLQLADRLKHRTYNVASGRVTTNAEIVEAIRTIVPDAELDLPDGGGGPNTYLSIDRIREDTGYEPEYDTQAAVSDYLGWLQAGHER